MTVLVTGAAGFIGFHAAQALLARGVPVVGVDCLTDYYDVALKRARLGELERHEGFRFDPLDLADAERFKALVLDVRPERILHLAAQAGVRYSLENPFAYTHANINGHLSVLEAARALGALRSSMWSTRLPARFMASARARLRNPMRSMRRFRSMPRPSALTS
jgi:UDP-glucuronate 4-epimerase